MDIEIARPSSFWYYMYEPIVDNTGPNLGKLAVWTRTRDRDDNAVMTPLWRLQNGQGPSWKYAQANIDSDRDYQVSQMAELSIHTIFFVFWHFTQLF